jgi:hypothetical protein
MRGKRVNRKRVRGKRVEGKKGNIGWGNSLASIKSREDSLKLNIIL